jgi:hypothetical protein
VVVGEWMFGRGFETRASHRRDENAGRSNGQRLSSIKDLSLYSRQVRQAHLSVSPNYEHLRKTRWFGFYSDGYFGLM